MKMRRIFAAVLAVVMMLSVMPMTAFGITTNDIDTKGTTTGPYNDQELYLGKTATLEDDGTYTIRLEAFATGNPVTTQIRSGLPLDIVLVLDQSGSMFTNDYLETLRDSVSDFIEEIWSNGNQLGVTHRVAVVGFASNEEDGSSNNAENLNHRVAGGSDNVYTNTGVFLEDGSFKNYGDATTSYVRVEGTPVPGNTYYICNSNRNYVAVTATASYSAVADPSTDREDLYARVGSSYYPAFYATNAYYKVTNPDPTKTSYYVDVDGVKMPITATVTDNYTYTQTGNISQNNGQVYYIDTDTSADGENWITVTCSGSNGNWTWTGSDGNTYTRTGNNNSNRRFTRNGTNYYAHTRSGSSTTTWKLADGTVIDTDEQTVYEHLSGWVYSRDGAYYAYNGTLYEVTSATWRNGNTTYDPAETPFFTTGTTGGLTNDDYRDALMPVSDGEAGAGDITAALTTAVSKLAASGATRTSLGMEMARKILDNRTSLGDEDKRQTVVVVFTDGNPGFSGFENAEANDALEISAELKASTENGGYGATVYTIGLYEGAATSSEISVFMHGLSSNYPEADEMSDVAAITYGNQQTINFSNLGLTTTPTVFDDYVVRYNDAYCPLRGYVNASGNRLTLEYYSGGEWNTWVDEDDDFTHSVYTRSCTEYDATGKHYMYASNVDALEEIFPEIVTDSTTATLDQKWLTADTILRDILGTGFVFTNGTTVTMSSLTGTPSGRMITWADEEEVIDSVTVTDADAVKTVSDKGFLSVHNQGGYAFVEATGFDFNTYFFGTSAGENGDEEINHETGAKLIVTISRVEATDLVSWNQMVQTNNLYSGVWSPVLEDGTRAQIGVFPIPDTYFTDTVAVLDYAKTTADLASELRQSGIKHLDADGMNYFTAAQTTLTDAYGEASASGSTLTYTPNTMKWDGYDSFYVFGNTTDATVLRYSANQVHSNLWSKVTVIPANNVYYEDTFVQSNGASVGIEYTGSWTQSNPGSNTETPEDGENQEGGGHGWEDSLADDTGYSDGTAAVGGNGATATFTFTGTGADIYSRTNLQTGMVMAAIYAGEKAEGVALRTLVIDNFAHSGDYYMIPTLSLHQKVKRVDGVTQYDDNGMIMYEDLGYGTYTVKLTVLAVTDDADFDGTESTRSTYYLDGIRVYNPMNPDNMTPVVKEAYGDEELNAAFVEVRDILLDANSFGDDEGLGIVFIDQVLNEGEDGEYTEGEVPGTTSEIAVYEAIGPENEVYLNNFQSIAFAPAEGETYYVGLKSPTGKPVEVMITGADGNVENIIVEHTTDLFYEVGTDENGIVVISNMSEDLLAVTKVKATHADPVMMTFAMFRSVSREEVLDSVDAAYAATAEPEAPEIEVEIENPETQEPEEQPGTGSDLVDLVIRIIGSLWKWFH